MNDQQKALEVLRDSQNFTLYLVATGAGAGIQQRIWSVPGCSSFFSGASFPYSQAESMEFAGLLGPQEGLRFASEEFAVDLAIAAFRRAITGGTKNPVGLAVTASVTSLKRHRGDHRAHIVCMTRDRILGRTIVIPKGDGSNPNAERMLDGETVDQAVVNLLLAAFDPKHPSSAIVEECARQRFFQNPVFFETGARGSVQQMGDTPMLFPGAFSPLHEGHTNLATAAQMSGEEVLPIGSKLFFTICATPPHKDRLTLQDMLVRASGLNGHPVVFTEGDPLFLDKARRFPGASFVLGADALIRMLDPKWGPDPDSMLNEFQSLRTRFVVFGRVIDGEYTSSEVAIQRVPERHRTIFYPISGRWDISSSEVRQRREVPDADAARGQPPT